MPSIPTPLVDEYLTGLDAAAEKTIATIDANELARERAQVAVWVAEKLTAPTHSVENRLRAWERLATRLAMIPGTDDYYLIDEYVNDLQIRDVLENVRAALPERSRESFSALLERLDARFREVTFDDGGEAVRWYTRSSSTANALKPWWHQRRPRDIPWSE